MADRKIIVFVPNMVKMADEVVELDGQCKELLAQLHRHVRQAAKLLQSVADIAAAKGYKDLYGDLKIAVKDFNKWAAQSEDMDHIYNIDVLKEVTKDET